MVAAGRLRATTDYAEAVPGATPSSSSCRSSSTTRRARTSAGWTPPREDIARGLQPGTLVSYETTLPVGTTRDPLEADAGGGLGLVEGADFHLVFSPERVLTGRVFADLRKYPKLVGGLSTEGAPRAVEFYEAVLDFDERPTWPVPTACGTSARPRPRRWPSSPRRRTATSTSAWRTSSRASRRGRDRRLPGDRGAATRQPYSHIHRPGIAVGGHCIPVYPRLYLWNDPDATVVRAAREANADMPAYAVGLAEARPYGDLTGMRVAVLGAAYRGGVKETAFSASSPRSRRCARRGARSRSTTRCTPTTSSRLGFARRTTSASRSTPSSCRPTTPSTATCPRRPAGRPGARRRPHQLGGRLAGRHLPGHRQGRGRGVTVGVRIADSADVDEGATIGDGTSVWHLAQVREDAVSARDCIVGRGAYVGTGVRMGDNCKLQNYALVYEPAVLEDGVFVGPAVVLHQRPLPAGGRPGRQPQARRRLGAGRRDRAARAPRSAPARSASRRSPIGRWALVAAGLGRDQGRAGLRARRRRSGPAHPLGRPRRRAARAGADRRPGCARRPARRYVEHDDTLTEAAAVTRHHPGREAADRRRRSARPSTASCAAACSRRARRSRRSSRSSPSTSGRPALRRGQLGHVGPAPRPARRGVGAGRRGDRAVVHLRRHRQLGRADRRDAGLRRHRADYFCLDPAPSRPRSPSAPSGIMPVHLYGHPADMTALSAIADGTAADLRGRRPGARRDAGTARRSARSARSRCSRSTRRRT